jgi:hypothetical protein
MVGFHVLLSPECTPATRPLTAHLEVLSAESVAVISDLTIVPTEELAHLNDRQLL